MKPYPVKRTEYNKNVGITRVINIAEIIEDLGFIVRIEKVEGHDVDIWVYNHLGTLQLVIEVTNWQAHPYMDPKRAVSIRDNLNNYSCRKLLVCSFQTNYHNQRHYFDPEIDILVFGFQTQPFYDWLLERGRADGMRPDDSETKEIVRRKIRAYLEEIGLI